MGISSSRESKKRSIRVLVLGIQSSGKSTFSKQMKILHCNGFKRSEVKNFRIVLIQNLFLGFKEIIQEAGHDISPDNKEYANAIMNCNPYNVSIDKYHIHCIVRLWPDPAISKIISQVNPNLEYIEIVKHLMQNNIYRLQKPDFVPTHADILHARQRTAGISEISFRRHKFHWTFIDVGGQRVERKKWLDMDKDLNAIVFLASLVDYDVPSEDDEAKTRMEESLDVWDEVLKSPMAQSIPLILFFNKIDLFRKKTKECPLNNAYPSYKGKSTQSAKRYIMQIYLKKLKKKSPDMRKLIKCHFICALDTENIRIIFNEIKNHIVKQRLKLSGI